MRIPRYWVRVEGQTPPDRGGENTIAVWGWSVESRADAERDARDRLTRVLDRVREGAGFPDPYAYGSRALREEILEEIGEGRGGPDAILTRNSYGSVVLNTARVLFVDVDVPAQSATGAIARLFGSNRPTPEAATLTRIREALQHDSGGSYRIYRTAAGFRVLATDRLFDPGSTDSERVMTSLGADRSFIQLCRAQQSFRARLTPKPWRCGLPNPPHPFPRERPDDRAEFQEWLATYDRAVEGRATCRFVESPGWDRVHEGASRIVDLHDRWSKASSELPLA
jgi:hypothetical protein